jgi:hypothetical protein
LVADECRKSSVVERREIRDIDADDVAEGEIGTPKRDGRRLRLSALRRQAEPDLDQAT